MMLRNANPVSTWIGEILTKQCSPECSCIIIIIILLLFYFIFYFFYFFYFLFLFFFLYLLLFHFFSIINSSLVSMIMGAYVPSFKSSEVTIVESRYLELAYFENLVPVLT